MSEAAATTQWADVSAKYLARLTNAVPPGRSGLAGVVSEGAMAVATMIGCQLDPRRAVEEARRSVAERYRDMTGTELSAELANRGLRSTGRVDERRERLIDSDFDGR